VEGTQTRKQSWSIHHTLRSQAHDRLINSVKERKLVREAYMQTRTSNPSGEPKKLQNDQKRVANGSELKPYPVQFL
jgi:hypothetical protein